MQDQLQSRLDGQVKEQFPEGGVRRVALLQYGDDPWVEPGDLLVQVFIEEAGEDPPLPAWKRDHEAMISELHRELTEKLPGASYLEFWFGENGRQGQIRQRRGCPPGDPARREQDLTPVDVRLGPVDLEMLDALITAGTAARAAPVPSQLWMSADGAGRPQRLAGRSWSSGSFGGRRKNLTGYTCRSTRSTTACPTRA